MARTKPTQEQQEYNSMLEVTQSMLGKIDAAMADIERQADKRNKKLSEELSITRSIIKEIQTEEDLEKAIELIRENNVEASKKDFGINQKLKDTFLAQEQALEGILSSHKEAEKVLNRVKEITDETKDKFDGILDGMIDDLEKIPIIGKTLKSVLQPSIDNIKEKFANLTADFGKGFTKSFATARAGGAGIGKSITAGIGGGLRMASRAAGQLLKAFLGPVGWILLAYEGIKAAFERMKELDAAAASFRKNTGLTANLIGETAKNIDYVSARMAGLGASAEDVASAAADFTNQFNGLQQPSKNVLSSMVILNKSFGIATKDAAAVNQIFQNIGALTATQSQYLANMAAKMSAVAGVPAGEVFKDMADNSEYAYKYFQGSPEKLLQATIEARKLGSSLKEAGAAADNLLDFESSISSELEASALLGVNLNAGRARYLASINEPVKAQQALLDEVEKLGDLNNTNIWQQQAIASFTGMTYESIRQQLELRKRFGAENQKDIAAAQELLALGKDLNDITSADIAAQNERMKNQNLMNSQFETLGNLASEFGVGLGDALMPVLDAFLPVIIDIFRISNDILMPVFRMVGSILGVLGTIIKAVFDLAIILIDMILQPFISIFEAIDEALAGFDRWFAGVSEWTSGIKSFFTGESSGYVVEEEESGASLTSTNQSAVTAINDGVISPNGDVISTSPEDFLIATKNPGSLTEAIGSAPTISMEGVIAELRTLKEAFLSNKDVYMDTVKVTSVVRKTTERASDNKFGTQFA